MKQLIIFIFALCAFNIALAEDFKIASMAQKQDLVFESVVPASNEEIEVFKLMTVAVLTRLEFEVEVPVIAKFTIRPEVELFWTR